MKPKTFILLSALSLLQLQTHGQSGEFSDAISELKTKNEEALQKLKDTRASIQDQKIPLASELSGLEREVEEKRRALIRLQRLRDNKSVGLTALKREVEGRKSEVQFLGTLGSDYLANFEARLHVAEIDRYQQSLQEIKSILDGDGTDKDKMIARMKLLTLSIDRTSELLGGTQFEGEALDQNGKVAQGDFVLSGPLAYFKGKSGKLAGLTEAGRDLKPRIFPLAGAQSTSIENFFSLPKGETGSLPIDATLGDAVKVAAAEDTIVQHIQKGGTWAYPIVFAAALASPE